MSSVSNGAGVDSGGGRKIVNFKRIQNNLKEKYNLSAIVFVPNVNQKSVLTRKQHAGRLFRVVLPVLIGILVIFPNECSAGKAKKDTGSQVGNFSQSPTNHEEVLSRNKKDHFIASSSASSGDDYWVGSNKLEFKPHPLLMPSTHVPMSQIPLPLIELGTPPTTSPTSGEGGEVDDLSESASEADEERKQKGKTRKSRGGRKKSRDQRRLAHRTLWARHNAASNVTNAYTTALHRNPYFLHNHHQIPNQAQQNSPVILTAGSMLTQQSPLLIPPFNNRNDESMSATAWNINQPGNGIIAPNLIQSYLPPQSGQQQNSVQTTSSSSSQESSQQQQQQPQYAPSNGGLHPFQFAYPQFHQQQQQLMTAQFASPQHTQQPQQLPLQMPPLAQGQYQFPMMAPSGPEYLPQQSGSTPIVVSGSNGPVLMYLGPGGIQGGTGQSPSGSGPIPAKPFNLNEIPGVGLSPHVQYNSITGPEYSSGYHNHNPHFQQQQQHNSGGSNSGSSTNPQYFRNNFLRMVMDKMATMGRMLPIPFVSKYASPPQNQNQQQHHQYQGYGRHTGFNRRMRKK